MESNELEKAILAHLSDKKIDKDSLKRYSAAINKLRKSNFIIDRIWKYGQPKPDDGIIVGGRIKTSDLGNLTDIFDNNDFKGFKAFPLGTVNPDQLEIRIQLGDLIRNVEL
ncbi:hypothetical protein [Rufibacter psychrotolerans]|uniref:hypothetical protein n=1 Tax=Rufibacter psychrotolerans TaxID=2812556 RepID=UPI0019681793|nr:hypothetical protein [Rufibacter sp. SYSU D00308]